MPQQTPDPKGEDGAQRHADQRIDEALQRPEGQHRRGDQHRHRHNQQTAEHKAAHRHERGSWPFVDVLDALDQRRQVHPVPQRRVMPGGRQAQQRQQADRADDHLAMRPRTLLRRHELRIVRPRRVDKILVRNPLVHLRGDLPVEHLERTTVMPQPLDRGDERTFFDMAARHHVGLDIEMLGQ